MILNKPEGKPGTELVCFGVLLNCRGSKILASGMSFSLFMMNRNKWHFCSLEVKSREIFLSPGEGCSRNTVGNRKTTIRNVFLAPQWMPLGSIKNAVWFPECEQCCSLLGGKASSTWVSVVIVMSFPEEDAQLRVLFRKW